ncbi:MAG TPA: nuclear transport factor 2 family protein [Miltoncostaeaceae bacterium]|nr:nuclear transport factor 2 family protein [Miltoncostaeaceae bacterium]
MSEELLLTAYERGWNAHDPDVCAACFSHDATRRSLLHDAPPATVGRDAIREGIASVMEALPDLAVEVVAAGYCSDRRLWTEWRAAGTPAAGGAMLEVLGVSVFRLSNAGFVEERLYWDSAFAR